MKIKFLVIRFSSIGDIVLTSPVVRCLKNQVDNAEIHFVTKEKFALLVESNPHVTRVHVFRNNISELVDELKTEEFDYIIDLHQNFRSNRIKSQLKAPSFTFEKLNVKKFLLVNFKINRLPEKHIVDRYLDSVSVFDVKNDGKGLDFFIPDDETFDTNNLPEKFRNGFVAFVIAGTYFTKKLPPDKILEICNALEHPVLLLGGRNEKKIGEEILSKSRAEIMNFVGKFDLNKSASLIKQANVVLTNDTGLMHIATAFKKKILSFWGNTVPEFGMYPYKPDSASKIIEVKDLKCRPCSKLGYQKCPKKHFKCMNDLNIDEVVQWVNANY